MASLAHLASLTARSTVCDLGNCRANQPWLDFRAGMDAMTLNEPTDSLATWVSDFGNRRVLVLGDAILDEYLLGECSRISPEAPVPVLKVTSADACSEAPRTPPRTSCRWGATPR